MEINFKVSVFLIFFLLIIFSGCTQFSPFSSKTTQGDIAENNPILLSGQQIISQPGYYQLMNDIAPSEVSRDSGGACVYFKIRSSDVVFDGMGHVMDGSKIKNPCTYTYALFLKDKGGAESQYTNVLIRNVTALNWTDGVQLHQATNFQLENTKMIGNTHGVEISASSNIIINNNSLIENRQAGLVGLDNENIVISNNTIEDNSHEGIGIMGQALLNHAPLEINILDRQILFYPEFWYLQQRTSGGGYIISHNVIKNNVDNGLYFSGSKSDVLEENLITNNGGYGIFLVGVENSLIRNNIINDNRDEGIRSDSRGINLVFENNTFSGNNGTIKTRYSTSIGMPESAIFGTILVLLLSLLGGTSKVAEKVGANIGIKRFSEKFKPIEEKISNSMDKLKISSLLNNNIAVSLIGAIIFGLAYTFKSLSSYGQIIEVFSILTLIGGVVVIVPKGVQYFAANKAGMAAEYRVWWGGVLIIFLTTLATGALLGNIFGQPVKTAIEREHDYEKKKLALVMLIGPLVSLVLSASFFVLYLMRGTYASLAWTGLNMSLLTAVVSFIPFSPMEGARVYKWNKLVWVAVFIPIVLAYGYFVILQ